MTYKIGEHLISPRLAAIYNHHGIYIGDEQVIHYSGLSDGFERGEIQIDSLDQFANGNPVDTVLHPEREYSREQSVKRAYSRIGEDWYNVLLNNCEHFVNWCIMGRHRSDQVNDAIYIIFEIVDLEFPAKKALSDLTLPFLK